MLIVERAPDALLAAKLYVGRRPHDLGQQRWSAGYERLVW